MTVNHVWTRRQEYQVTGLGYTPEGSIKTSNDIVELSQDSTLEYLVRFAALCSNAKVIEPDEQHSRYSVLGDPTEACLIVLAKKAGLSLLDNENWAKRIRELPFDSSRKRMTTIHQLSRSFQSTSYLAISKGSPKELVDLCPWIMDKGIVRPMMEEDRAAIMQANDVYARQGLRVLAVAYRDLEKANSLPTSVSDYTPELIEYDLVFMGLVAMSDPPREEVAAAVAKCHDASIRIIMVTGDYGLTAVSIAKRIGIVRGDSPRVVTGAELKRMSDEELRQVLLDEVVFARVAPEQKYRVVSQLQALGHVVAVTGDGVNDAPALKKADIGVAMGITGTDVAKESADMILTDDNFASIVKAVEEGRAVYYNIQKFLTYIFNSNTSEAVPSATFLFSRGAIPLPLTVMQILAIDLGTDMLPALGLGVEKPEEGLMSRPPRNISDPLLHLELLIKAFVWYGLMEAGLAMGAFFFTSIGHQVSLSQLLANDFLYRQATTMTLGAIIFCQLGMVLNCRTLTQSVFKLKLFSNVTINLGMVFEIVLFASLTYLPVLNSLFHTAPLSMWQWGYLFLCPLPILGIEEVRKAYLRHRST
ncbi:magnesium-transporting ATPase (P-type) [Streptococcus porcorum]|uniref:Magnesium-transporting ATPase (P-type) n=1 Tax=Streptococcus porcorum TaxID=701526 RepID=A0ABV2JDA7_9STRE